MIVEASEIKEQAAALAERLHVPGVAVGVYQRGEETYAYHGVTSLDNPLPIDQATLFQIGSTTKTFTATAIMRLVEEGRIDLDAPVRTYVPELRLKDEGVAARVTVLQLLNHTAGWDGDFFLDTGDGDDALARYVVAMAELEQVNPPGKTVSYNNASLCLAGRVIEKVTGTTYEAALTQLVLEPLGLKHSHLFPAEVMTYRFAVGHVEREGTVQVARPWRLPRSSTAAGALVCTAPDQIRYARFHLGDGTAGGERVLRTETLERMKRATANAQGSSLGDEIGIGWLLKDAGGVRLAGHGGTTNGQQSGFQLVPEHDFAFTILTNSDAGHRLERELTAWLLDTYLGIAPQTPEPLSLTSAELEVYAGRFASDTTIVAIKVEGTGLVAEVEYTEEARAKLRALLGEIPNEPPFAVGILPDDGFLVLGGRSDGARGTFVREGAGIAAINFGGRLARRL